MRAWTRAISVLTNSVSWAVCASFNEARASASFFSARSRKARAIAASYFSCPVGAESVGRTGSVSGSVLVAGRSGSSGLVIASGFASPGGIGLASPGVARSSAVVRGLSAVVRAVRAGVAGGQGQVSGGEGQCVRGGQGKVQRDG